MKIIAEVGSNIKSYEDSIKCCTMAKGAGADYVKFQCFSKHDLYGEGSKAYTSFQLDWFEGVKGHCDEIKIEFMCTGFDSEVYEIIDAYVSTHKIASSEITDMHILDKVNSFGKPIFLSTGGATNEQIKEALDKLKDCKVTIFYCEPSYPAKIINFQRLLDLRSVFGLSYDYGYSDHSIDVLYIPSISKVNGSTVLEKHVNFLDYKDTPDAGHSLNFFEFKMMCYKIKNKPLDYFKSYVSHRVFSNGKYVRPKIEHI